MLEGGKGGEREREREREKMCILEGYTANSSCPTHFVSQYHISYDLVTLSTF